MSGYPHIPAVYDRRGCVALAHGTSSSCAVHRGQAPAPRTPRVPPVAAPISLLDLTVPDLAICCPARPLQAEYPGYRPSSHSRARRQRP